jgi:DNA-binding transcriptional ArsR family regulator
MPPVTPFPALADPSRCRVLELLRERVRPVHDLAAELNISRPAISPLSGLIGTDGSGPGFPCA